MKGWITVTGSWAIIPGKVLRHGFQWILVPGFLCELVLVNAVRCNLAPRKDRQGTGCQAPRRYSNMRRRCASTLLLWDRQVTNTNISSIHQPHFLCRQLWYIWLLPQHYTWLLRSMLSYHVSLVSLIQGLGPFLVHWLPKHFPANMWALPER